MTKLKPYALVFLGAVVLGIGLWLQTKNRSPSRMSSENHDSIQTSESNMTTTTEEGVSDPLEEQYSELVTPEEEAFRPAGVSRGAWAYAMEELRVKGKLNGEVLFFGRIVDENGDPIAGVSLTAELLSYETSIPKMLRSGEKMPVEETELVSDGEGRISLIESVGARLTLKDFTKEGYELVGRKYFRYSFGDDKSKAPHIGDPENPEIFTMKRVE